MEFDETSINSLPDEIFIKIFSFIEALDRIQQISLVCRRWKRLAFFHDFQTLNVEALHDTTCQASNWCNLRLAAKDKRFVTQWLSQFLQRILPTYGIYLRTVDLNFRLQNKSTVIEDSILKTILINCPNVIELNLLNCEMSRESLPILAQFRSLKRLAVVDDWKFQLAGIWQHLRLTHIDSRASLPLSCYGQPEDLVSIKTDVGCNFFLNLSLFADKYVNVEEVCVKNCRFIPAERFSLLCLLGRLKRLELELYDHNFHYDELVAVCDGCSLLEDLSLTFIHTDNNEDLEQLQLQPLKNLQYLKRFSFKNQLISDVQLCVVSCLTGLKSLELQCCKFSTLEDFFQRPSSPTKEWPNLEIVSICNYVAATSSTFIDDDCSLVLDKFLSNCSNVKRVFTCEYSRNQLAGIPAWLLISLLQKSTMMFDNLADAAIYFENVDEISTFFGKCQLNNLLRLKLVGSAQLDISGAVALAKCCPNITQLVSDISFFVDAAVVVLNECKNLELLQAVSSVIQLPSEELMFAIGSHLSLRKFSFKKLLPSYHSIHFQSCIDGRKQLVTNGRRIQLLSIETVGTFSLPKQIINDLKSTLICFTNAQFIETFFRHF